MSTKDERSVMLYTAVVLASVGMVAYLIPALFIKLLDIFINFWTSGE